MKATDDELKAAWDNDDGQFADILFDSIGSFYGNWVDIAGEVRRIWNLVMDDDVEHMSRIDDLLCGAAVGGVRSAFRCVSLALGIDPERLEEEMEGYLYPGAQPITADELISLCSRATASEAENGSLV